MLNLVVVDDCVFVALTLLFWRCVWLLALSCLLFVVCCMVWFGWLYCLFGFYLLVSYFCLVLVLLVVWWADGGCVVYMLVCGGVVYSCWSL